MIASDENLDEIASRAEQIYERDIRPHVEPGHEGEFVVVNADTGEYEIDADAVAASERALARFGNAPLFMLRIGSPATYKLGAHSIGSRG